MTWQQTDYLDISGPQSDFLMSLTLGRLNGATVVLLDLSPRKSHLAGVMP